MFLCLIYSVILYSTALIIAIGIIGLHNSNVCRLFKKLEPLMGKRLPIKKDRTLTPEAILKLLADVTEQSSEKPQAQENVFRQEETPYPKSRNDHAR